MRKITLLSLAAATAIAASGAMPTVNKAVSAKAHAASVQKATSMNKSALNLSETLSSKAPESRADEATTPSTFPLYQSVGAFYLGMQQDLKPYKSKFGFTSATGVMGYVPSTTATAYDWTSVVYGEAEDGSADNVTLTSDQKNFVVNLEPLMQFAGPTLKATLATGVVDYNDSTIINFAGGDPYFWGFYGSDDKEAPVETQYLVGTTPCPFDGNKWSNPVGAAINRTGAAGYNAAGTHTAWDEIFQDESGTPVYTDPKIVGYSYKMPATIMPYQLSGFYMWVSSEVDSEEAVPLTVMVYGYNEEGYLDKNIVLGRGVASLPAGKFDGTIAFTLQAVNANGRPINSPICTNEDMWISIQGFENENIKVFSPVYNFNLEAPVEDWRNEVYKSVYPAHAIIDMKVTDAETKEEIDFPIQNPWIYGEGPVYFAREYAMYFFIDFPIVMNAEDGTGTFEATLPVEGNTQFYIASTEDIEQLYMDDTLIGVADEWISYDITYDETEELPVLTVWANSDCPETETEGRTGKITFTGYACDFTVTVTQPAGGKGTPEGSISEIAGAAQGVAEYFDLQGRKLSAAPAKGVYIQRTGSTATKLVK